MTGQIKYRIDSTNEMYRSRFQQIHSNPQLKFIYLYVEYIWDKIEFFSPNFTRMILIHGHILDSIAQQVLNR